MKDIIYFESQGRKINIVTQNRIMTFMESGRSRETVNKFKFYKDT